jgi:hypothetical protein
MIYEEEIYKYVRWWPRRCTVEGERGQDMEDMRKEWCRGPLLETEYSSDMFF